MPAIFPWSSQSPLIAAALIVGTMAALALAGILRHLVNRASADDGFLARRLRSPERVRALLRRATAWALLVAGAYGALFVAATVWAPLRPLLLDPVLARLPHVGAGAVALGAALLLLDLTRQLTRMLEQPGPRRQALAPQVAQVLDLSLRYSIVAATALALSAILLDALGLTADLGARATAWLAAQAGSLALIGVLCGAAWAGGRILRAITADMRYRSRTFSPEVVDGLGGAARGVLYVFTGILVTFTILNAVGLGTVGGTMVVVLSSMLGLVVAMAATGSIGNALSGLVLLAVKPYRRGDRVVLGEELVGDVEDVHAMFTRVRTLAGEVVEVPNNLVLQRPMRNLSRSGSHAIVVSMGIGYDISHDLVRRLGVEAACATDGILSEPKPQVFATRFGNFAIEYDVYAYTRDPRHLQTRSALLGKLQEVFYANGVEILTPDVHVVRRGRSGEAEGPVRVRVEAGPAHAIAAEHHAAAEPAAPARD